MENKSFLPLRQATELFPGRVAPSTVRGWIRDGVNGIRLDALRVGGRIFVSPAAADEFLRAINAAATSARSGQ